MLIWTKPVDGVSAVWLQVKLTEWLTGEFRLWPQTFSVLVWFTLTSVVEPLVLSAGSARVQAPDVTVPPLGVQASAPMVACAPLLPSITIVRPAVRRVAIASGVDSGGGGRRRPCSSRPGLVATATGRTAVGRRVAEVNEVVIDVRIATTLVSLEARERSRRLKLAELRSALLVRAPGRRPSARARLRHDQQTQCRTRPKRVPSRRFRAYSPFPCAETNSGDPPDTVPLPSLVASPGETEQSYFNPRQTLMKARFVSACDTEKHHWTKRYHAGPSALRLRLRPDGARACSQAVSA